jgi:hypothetical protein
MKAILNFGNPFYGHATFKLHGKVIHHSYVYWTSENTHQIIHDELNVPEINLWARAFVCDTVTGNNYLEMLEDVVLAEIRNIPTTMA